MTLFKNITFLCLQVILFCAITIAESAAQPSADAIYQAGLAQQQAKQYDKAIQLFEQAMTLYQRANDVVKMHETRLSLAKCFYYQSAFAVSTKHLDDLLRDSTLLLKMQPVILADAYLLKGRNHFFLKQSEDATVQHLRSLKLLTKRDSTSQSLLIQNYIGLSEVARWLKNDYFAAEQYLEKALITQENYGVRIDPPLLFRIYYNLASIYREKLDIDRALSAGRNALNLLENGTFGSQDNYSQCYQLIANIHNVGNQPQKAIEFYEKAIAFSLKNKDILDRNNYLSRLYNNLGVLYGKLESWSLARKYHYKVFSLQKGSKQFSEELVDSWVYLGEAFTHEQRPDSAIYYLQRGLKGRKNLYKEQDKEIANMYYLLGNFHQSFTSPDSALYYYQKALQIMSPGFRSTRYADNPASSALSDVDVLDILLAKGITLQKRYMQNGLKVADLQHALATFQVCDTLMQSFQGQLEREASKLYFSSQKQELYESALEVLDKLLVVAPKDEYLEIAFRFMENSKAKILTGVLSNLLASENAGIPDSVMAHERRMKYDYSLLINQRSEERSAGKLQQIEKQIFEKEREIKRFYDELAKIYPVYARLKYQRKDHGLNDLRMFLKSKNVALIEFFWGERNLYIFSAQPAGNVKLISLPHDAYLDEMVDSYRESLIKGYRVATEEADFKIFVGSSFRLYEHLLKESFGKKLPAKLIVIPDGMLSIIPFEAMITAKTNVDQVNYQALNYLLLSTEIYYGYSYSMLRLAEQITTPVRKDLSVLGLSFSDNSIAELIPSNKEQYVVRGGMEDLFWAAAELDMIDSLFEGSFFKGNNATEDIFKKEAPNYDILHLALHGYADSGDSLKNCLVFKSATIGSGEDGVLYAYELYKLRLKARLVVLSACESGAGRLQVGEGIYSIGRGFTYAGCPVTLMTLWPISDQMSVGIMEAFYRGLKAGIGYAESLVSAKKSYLANADEISAHPAFWAPMVQIGPNDTLFETDEELSPLLIGGVAAGAALFLLLLWRMMKGASHKKVAA